MEALHSLFQKMYAFFFACHQSYSHFISFFNRKNTFGLCEELVRCIQMSGLPSLTSLCYRVMSAIAISYYIYFLKQHIIHFYFVLFVIASKKLRPYIIKCATALAGQTSTKELFLLLEQVSIYNDMVKSASSFFLHYCGSKALSDEKTSQESTSDYFVSAPISPSDIIVILSRQRAIRATQSLSKQATPSIVLFCFVFHHH